MKRNTLSRHLSFNQRSFLPKVQDTREQCFPLKMESGSHFLKLVPLRALLPRPHIAPSPRRSPSATSQGTRPCLTGLCPSVQHRGNQSRCCCRWWGTVHSAVVSEQVGPRTHHLGVSQPGHREAGEPPMQGWGHSHQPGRPWALRAKASAEHLCQGCEGLARVTVMLSASVLSSGSSRGWLFCFETGAPWISQM